MNVYSRSDVEINISISHSLYECLRKVVNSRAFSLLLGTTSRQDKEKARCKTGCCCLLIMAMLNKA